MPKRIQRKRTKGWRMPENTVFVGRPTKWGNPFKIGEWTEVIHKSASYPYEMYMDSFRVEGASHAVNLFEMAAENKPDWFHESYKLPDIKELKGKNLACWCKQDEPCHADILLKLANDEAI